MKRSNLAFIICTLLFLMPVFVQAQFYRDSLSLHWQMAQRQNHTIPTFEGASHTPYPSLLPYYVQDVPLILDGQPIAELNTGKVKLLSERETAALPEGMLRSLPSDFTVAVYRSQGGDEITARLEILPLRRNAAGQVEQLVDGRITLYLDPSRQPETQGRRGYSKNGETSVLASGSWYKIGVTEDGIYKIDRSLLGKIGLNAGNINPNNIRIYGKPGGMLPQPNAIGRDYDLVENAIEVHTNGDGSFDYLLFYAKGPASISYDTVNQRFRHQYNYFCDTAYYFITASLGAGKRIQLTENPSGTPARTVIHYKGYAWHERDIYHNNSIMAYVKSGREWWGEQFGDAASVSSTQNFAFSLPRIDRSVPAEITVDIAAHGDQTSSFSISANGSKLGNDIVMGVSPIYSGGTDPYLNPYAVTSNTKFDYTPSGTTIDLALTYKKFTPKSLGWLNWVGINYQGELRHSGGQWSFRDVDAGANALTAYTVSNASNIQVWDATDFHNIKKMPLDISGSNASFKAKADTFREFVIHDGSGYKTPMPFNAVANQNLHGLPAAEMIIVVHPSLWSAAERLANFHRQHDGMAVHMVTPQQVYNEFSSGAQDITAIRDMMRYFYTTAQSPEERPKYLMLFGDASYDYKNRVPNNTNLVPTYESYNSLAGTNSYASDDYYAFLDEEEGRWLDNDDKHYKMDIAVGRIPVHTLDQANIIVDKILRYHSPEAQGEWRNQLIFMADDEDGNAHFNQIQNVADKLETERSVYNLEKIYLDAYRQQTIGGGHRYPEAEDAVHRRINNGALVFNYVGHGGVIGLTHEHVIRMDDINGWENKYRLPLFITATCEFTRFDEPGLVSAGEQCLLNPNGGAIALFTTTRVAYIHENGPLNEAIVVNNLFQEVNGQAKTIGEAFRVAKNRRGFSTNYRCFTLMGDPAMRLAVPPLDVRITSFNNQPVATTKNDTLNPLSLVTISGEIRNSNGARVEDFNGTIIPTVYDVLTSRKTLANDPGRSYKADFTMLENIIYRGPSTVENGRWTFSFIVPKDISYSDQWGKLSFYAYDGKRDAHGYDSVTIGTRLANIPDDDEGPKIRLFINDTSFRAGGITNESPVLLAHLSDDMGINTTGNGIGHDIKMWLNNGAGTVLNSYFQTTLNSYSEGWVNYPIGHLAEGDYTLTLEAWDVTNNSSRASIDFKVINAEQLTISNLINFPNPVSDWTSFRFEHNRPDEELRIIIEIYDLSGRQITGLQGRTQIGSSGSPDIRWDGRSTGGSPVAPGLYIYRVVLEGADGQKATQSEKLLYVKKVY